MIISLIISSCDEKESPKNNNDASIYKQAAITHGGSSTNEEGKGITYFSVDLLSEQFTYDEDQKTWEGEGKRLQIGLYISPSTSTPPEGKYVTPFLPELTEGIAYINFTDPDETPSAWPEYESGEVEITKIDDDHYTIDYSVKKEDGTYVEGSYQGVVKLYGF